MSELINFELLFNTLSAAIIHTRLLVENIFGASLILLEIFYCSVLSTRFTLIHYCYIFAEYETLSRVSLSALRNSFAPAPAQETLFLVPRDVP